MMGTLNRIVAVILVAACSGGGEMHLSGTGTDDPAGDVRRRRMNVIVTVTSGATTDEVEMGVRRLAYEYILADCFEILESDPESSVGDEGCTAAATVDDEAGESADPPTFLPISNCSQAVCRTQAAVCVANRLLELSAAVAPTSFTKQSDPVEVVTVPAQDVESQIGFSEEAFFYAAWATTVAGENFRNAAGHTESGQCDATELETSNLMVGERYYGEVLASSLGEAAMVAREAANAAARLHAAVADADPARTPDIGLASKYKWIDGTMSRARGAHVIAGGRWSEGIAITQEGFYPRAPLSMKGREALDVLRLAGPKLTTLVNPMATFETIFETNIGTDIALGARLAQETGDTTLASMDAAEFLASRGLSDSDFLEARIYLYFEANVFGRAASEESLPAHHVPSERDSGGELDPQLSTIPIYTATSTPPSLPPAVYFRTNVRAAGAIGTSASSAIALLNDGTPAADGGAQPGPEYGMSGAAQNADYVDFVIGDVLPDSVAASNWGELLAEYPPATQVRVEGCYRYYDNGTSNVDELRLRVYGAVGVTHEDLLVVNGLDDLKCAVTGTIDGAECTIASYGTIVNSGDGDDGDVGFRDYSEVVLTVPYSTSPQWLYLLRKSATGPEEPGFYLVLGGMVLVFDHIATDEGYRYCTLYPVSPDIDDLVMASIGPEPDDIGNAATSCAGIPISKPIPLQNELSTDQDPYESSWRVYLERAKIAAEFADALGQQLLEAGLELDRRTETAEEELEAICGGAVSLSSYFPSATNPARGSDCPMLNDGDDCPVDGQKCRNGICVRDPMDVLESALGTTGDLMAERLSTCIGDDSVYDFVTLGADRLCVWTDDMTGEVCTGTDSSFPTCPYLMPETLVCAAPTGKTAAPVDITLNLVPSADPPDVSDGSDLDCELVRELRDASFTGSARLSAVSALSNSFKTEEVTQIAGRLGWDALPGDYSVITLDGQPLFATGDPYETVEDAGAAVWPCEEAYLGMDGGPATCLPDNPTDTALNTSLFCSHVEAGDCHSWVAGSTSISRVRMNHRMGRAVIALRMMTGVGLGPRVKGPFKPDGISDYAWNGSTAGRLIAPSTMGGSDRLTETTSSVDYASDVGEMQAHAICFASGVDDLWTHLPSGPAGSGTTYSASCGSRNPQGEAVFIRYPSYLSGMSHVDVAVRDLWMGLDGVPVAGGAGRYHRKIEDLLKAPGNPDHDFLSWETTDTQLTSYWDEDLDGDRGFDGENDNEIQLLEDGLKKRDVLDALELVCEVRRMDYVQTCGPQPPLADNAIDNLVAAEDYLNCKANELVRIARHQVLTNVPVAALNGLDGAYQFEGERGAAAGEFAAAIIGMRDYHRNISLELNNFASTVRMLRNALDGTQIESQLAALSLLSTISTQAATCGGGIMDAIIGIQPTTPTAAVAGTAGSAIMSCVNAFEQINVAIQSEALTQEQLVLQGDTTWEQFKVKFRDHAESIIDNVDEFEKQATLMRAALAEMENQRGRGQRAVAVAMALGTDAAGRQFNVNTVTRRRYNTLQIRYQDALKDAIAMAWIARRAIEQRLGVALDSLHDDLSLVDAPVRWAQTVCMSTGIDYGRIRDESGLDVDDYADAFIGDYVRKLEQVMYSYEQDFPFSDAEDTAVISLRDDVLMLRRMCEVDVPNLLAYSAQLDMTSQPETNDPVWQVMDCDPTDCVRVDEIVTVAPPGPIPGAAQEWGAVPAFEITFSPGSDTAMGTDSAYAQTVALSPGYYRLSWYGEETSVLDPLDAVTVRDSSGDVLGRISARESGPDPDGYGWRRYHLLFEIEEMGSYQVAIVPDATLAAADTEHSVRIAGVMVEDVSALLLAGPGQEFDDNLAPALYPPAYYVATTQAGRGNGYLCEDTHGEILRTRWERGCEQLCPSGFGSCEGDGETHCYWQVRLPITLAGIETGGVLKQSGFAYGNYNYRSDTVAVNFVGTEIRDCSQSSSPSTCYSSGTIPYSLYHLGGYDVRNHFGDVYAAPLYPGRIEHGRGLAAERYISNPISSSDRTLLQDFWHAEFQGRPLVGDYALRVWDADGVTIRNIEDVQLVLNYRYWTRLSE